MPVARGKLSWKSLAEAVRLFGVEKSIQMLSFTQTWFMFKISLTSNNRASRNMFQCYSNSANPTHTLSWHASIFTQLYADTKYSIQLA